MKEKMKQATEKKINELLTQGVQAGNIDMLYKLVDIHKDIANEEYWEEIKEAMNMKYRTYSEYGNDSYGRRARDSRGRYTEGSMGRGYRGHDMIDEMSYHYGNYEEGRSMYGGHGDTQSLEYMLNAAVEFIDMLKRDASSQDEVRLIQQYAKKIGNV